MINKHIGKPRDKPLISSITYALPVIAVTLLYAPINILQGIYAKYHGLALVDIATIVLIARLFDAVTDPLIGYYSDLYRQSRGHRKPFIICGGMLVVLSGYFLYVPPVSFGLGYFALWYMLFYLAFTLFDISHLAWGSEHAQSSEEKARLFGVRSVAGYGALIMFYSIPMWPFFDSQDITPITLQVNAVFAAVIMPLFLWLCITRTPQGKPAAGLCHATLLPQGKILALCELGRDIFGNRPFFVFTLAYVFIFLGNMLWYAVIFLYVDVYLGQGAMFAQVFLLSFVVGLIATPFWVRLAVKWGKKPVWLFATLLVMLSFIYPYTLTTQETAFWQLVLLKLFNTLGFTCYGVVSYALLSEIVDYDSLKSGRQRSGVYFAVFTFTVKAVGALGAALGLAVIGIFGFDATAEVQTAAAIRGLMLVLSGLPLVFSIAGAILIALIPMNERRHRIIRRALERNQDRRQRGQLSSQRTALSSDLMIEANAR